MTWLAFVFNLALGVMPLGTVPTWENQVCTAESTLEGSLFTDLGMRMYLWDVFYVGGGVKTLMYAPQALWTNASFDPFQSTYKIEVGLEAPINRHTLFALRWNHFCTHPVITYLPTKRVCSIYEGAYEELSIGVSVDTRR